LVIYNVLLPIFFVIFLGFLLRKLGRLDERVFSRAQLYVLSPALVFMAMTRAEAGALIALRMLLFVFTLSLIILAITQGLGFLLKRGREDRYAMSMTAVLMNSGFYGIPVCMLAFGDQGLIYASIFVVTSSMVQSTLGIYLANAGKKKFSGALLSIFRVPLIYSIVVARFLVHFDALPPEPLLRMIDLLGQSAIPLGLLLLGMQLERIMFKPKIEVPSLAGSGAAEVPEVAVAGIDESGSVDVPGSSPGAPGVEKAGAPYVEHADGEGYIKNGVMAGMIRIVFGFITASLLLRFFGFEQDLAKVILVESSMPTAVNAVVYATEFTDKPRLVAVGVLSSTLASVISVTLILTYAV